MSARYWLSRLHELLTPIAVIEHRFRFIPLLGCLTILFNDAEFFFKQTAMFRAIESLYCIEYYTEIGDVETAALGRSIPESSCKDEWIEQRVAKTYGWIMFFRILPCIFTAIPLGYLADRAGRRLVLCLHKIGTIFFVATEILVYLFYPTLPIWTLYISAFGAIIGANFDLSLAMLFASYSDVIPSPEQRATLFFVTTSMQYMGQAVFPLLAGRLIDLDGKGGTPEISLYAALATASLTLAMTFFFFPETLQRQKKSEAEVGLLATEDEDEDALAASRQEDTGSPSPSDLDKNRFARLASKTHAHLTELFSALGLLNLLLLVAAMLFASTAIKSIDLLGLIQFPVVKFGWKFSEVTVATSVQAFVYIINYLCILPFYTWFGTYSGLSSASTSLITMLWQALILTFGSTSIGFSSSKIYFFLSMSIYTLGTGLPTIMQAYISTLVDKKYIGRVLSALSIFIVAGKLLASSLGPFIFGLGIKSESEVMKGFLFFFCAILFVMSGVTVALVALRAQRTRKDKQRRDLNVALGSFVDEGRDDEDDGLLGETSTERPPQI